MSHNCPISGLVAISQIYLTSSWYYDHECHSVGVELIVVQMLQFCTIEIYENPYCLKRVKGEATRNLYRGEAAHQVFPRHAMQVPGRYDPIAVPPGPCRRYEGAGLCSKDIAAVIVHSKIFPWKNALAIWTSTARRCVLPPSFLSICI